MYSYGLPPEILGLNALSEHDMDYVRGIYANFDSDIIDALRYLNKDNLKLFPSEISKLAEQVASKFNFEIDNKHKKITSIIAEDLGNKDQKLITENITRAGFIRGFLG